MRLEQLPFSSRRRLEKVYVDPSSCFGCGLCRLACAHEAITLIPREEQPEAAQLWQ